MNERLGGSDVVNHVMVHNVMARLPGRDPSQLTLAIADPPGDKIGLEILAAPGPVTLTAQLRWLGLPALQGQAIQARPDWMMPAPFNPTADSTFLTRTFRKESRSY